MPKNKPLGSGATTTAAAVLSSRFSVALTGDAEVFTLALNTEGMPSLLFWMQQSAGAVGVTVRPQFAARLTTGGAVPVQEWLDIVPTFVLVPGVPGPPQRVQLAHACKWIRLGLQRSAGVASTVQVYLAAWANT